MDYILIPNIPEGQVGYAIVDGRISGECEKRLISLGLSLIKTKKYPGLYEAISYHPDIMLHHLGGNRILLAPKVDQSTIIELEELGFSIIVGDTELSPYYPYDIAYNVARIGNIAFHNLKYIDPVLKSELIKMNVKLIHVNQGYSKCSISIIDDKSIITSDKGIARIASDNGLDVLLVEEDVNINLLGLNHGFIGGSSGLVHKNKWAVTGDFMKLAGARDIKNFLKIKGIDVVSLSNGPICDLGSIIPLTTK